MKDNNNSKEATYKITSEHIKLQTSGSSHKSKKEAHAQKKKNRMGYSKKNKTQLTLT